MYMHVFVFICNYFYKYLNNYTQSFLLIKHIIMFIIGKYVFVYTQLHIHMYIYAYFYCQRVKLAQNSLNSLKL